MSVKPSRGPLSALSDDEFSAFIFMVGTIFFNSVGAAAFARHKRPLNTIRDYLDPAEGKDERHEVLAREFVRDLARERLDTAAMALKWHGVGPDALQLEFSEGIGARVRRPAHPPSSPEGRPPKQ